MLGRRRDEQQVTESVVDAISHSVALDHGRGSRSSSRKCHPFGDHQSDIQLNERERCSLGIDEYDKDEIVGKGSLKSML